MPETPRFGGRHRWDTILHFVKSRGVNMTADHPVAAAIPGMIQQPLLEPAQERNHALDPSLQPAAQPPRRPAQPSTDLVDQPIDGQQQFVAQRPQVREPAGAEFHIVELVPVQHQVPAAIDGLVNELVGHFDPQVVFQKLPQELVVVSGCIADRHTGGGPAQKVMQDPRVGRIPTPGTAETPAVDKVAYDVQEFRLVGFQKRQKGCTRARFGAPTATQPTARSARGVHAEGF